MTRRIAHLPRRGPGCRRDPCAMLGEAHRQLERRTDVVAAVVETHGRREVSDFVVGVEVVPRALHLLHGGHDSPGDSDVEAVFQQNQGDGAGRRICAQQHPGQR